MPDNGQNERFAEIEQTWFDADHNYHSDMSRTRTEAQARAVDDNWANARAACVRALADGLARNSDDVDAAIAALKNANRVSSGLVSRF